MCTSPCHECTPAGLQAVINTNGKHVHLGTFNEEEDAARIFDKAAIIGRQLVN